jgi:hypothetical protein
MNVQLKMARRFGTVKMVDSRDPLPSIDGHRSWRSLNFNGSRTAAISVAVCRLPGWMTEPQRDLYRMLATRWPRVSEPERDSDDGAIRVECFYPGALGSFIVRIELDGVQARLSAVQSSDA